MKSLNDVKELNVNFLPAPVRENLASGEDIKLSLGKLQKIIEELDLVNVFSVDVEAHNADPAAHPVLRAALNEIKDRVLAIEIAGGAEVTANSFAVTFGTLDGVEVSGVWNQSEARMEF